MDRDFTETSSGGDAGRKVTKQILDPFRSLVVGLNKLLQKCENVGPQIFSAISEQ